MKIAQLTLTNFRNFHHATISPGSSINLFYGANGSGKTSLLEAIHYLGLGRSFRTRNISRIINYAADRFSLFCQLSDDKAALPIGIERLKDKNTNVIKIAGSTASSLVEIIKLLPLQAIHANSQILLNSGSVVRRQFLDWGLFHVEPLFYQYWQRCNRIIKQRNALIKTALNYQEITNWDEELINSAMWLHEQRLNYIEAFQQQCLPLLQQLIGSYNYEIRYYCGWNLQKSLKTVLETAFPKDKALGYSQYGPHRADLQLKINGIAAIDILSQGQQKLAAYALKIAQAQVLFELRHKQCIFVIDDLSSELDQNKCQLVADLLLKYNTQLFISVIDRNSVLPLLQTQTKVFHVEQGHISKES